MIVDNSVRGLTSATFHFFVWLFVAAGVIFNVLVMVWRCSRKESRCQLLSILIVSLAVADLLWCSHYLVQEIMLLRVISAEKNATFSFTVQDEAFCLTSLFLAFGSCNALMTTAVAIALYTVFTLRGSPRRDAVIYAVMAISWIFSLALATAITIDTSHFSHKLHNMTLTSDAFSLIAMLGCMENEERAVFPVIVTSVNAAASVACAFVYGLLVFKLSRSKATLANTDPKHVQIRLTIITLVNVVVWWPPCIMYWYSHFRQESLFNGKLNVDAVWPVMMFTVIVTSFDPLIYTMVSTRFKSVICLVFVRGCRKYRKEARRPLVLETADEPTCGCRAACRLICQIYRKRRLTGDAQSVGSTTDETRSSYLFSDFEYYRSYSMSELQSF